jgi:hypothetical protein
VYRSPILISPDYTEILQIDPDYPLEGLSFLYEEKYIRPLEGGGSI